MKKYEFNLEKLLSYKCQMLDSAMLIMGQLQKELLDKEYEMQAVVDKKKECKKKMDHCLSGYRSASTFRVHLPYMQQLDEQIAMKREEIKGIKMQIEEQRERIKEQRLETKPLEILKETGHEEHRKEELKKEEYNLEEFVANSKKVSETQEGFCI